MATGSYMTPIYYRSQSEVLGDLHKVFVFKFVRRKFGIRFSFIKISFIIRSKKIDLTQLARDLDESPDPSMSKIVLRDLIISSKYYKVDEAKELLEVIAAERLETEQQQKLEQQEQLSIEKLCLEIELSRNANQS
ncbi:hypothetical protein TNCV_4123721 [Trichonephila clavipes]|nr:hypothetical protein TNCV_4123721 [Trichonephila clavipes]